ncbi:MAG: hypothetical protein HS111_33880 [Kofleriaceae bacterium]|nr:hypothetical protein [Kofleriaceae bacterium]MCL4227763.1 hypothetical protein [Myxococcales bacterium]
MSIRYLLAAALFAGGCVGDLTPVDDDGDDDGTPDAGGGGGGGLARQMFERDVFPILQAKCGAGCHLTTSSSSTPFVATAVGTAYITTVGFDSVVGNFTTTGAAIYSLVVPGPHQARTYTADEQMKVAAWLAQEVSERSGGGGGGDGGGGGGEETPAQATARIISEWSGCLKLEDFQQLDFGGSWANKGSNQGNCEQCHTSGAYGFKANDDNAGMYETLTTNKYYMMSYFAPDISNLADAKMVPNFPNFIRVGLRQVPHQEHPSYNTNLNDAAFQRLQQLYDRTMAYKAAGTCGPPRIP